MDGIVTVIVPVYNAGKYIARCIDSILSQTFENIEIICIDSSSTDNSLNILEHYQKFDSRVNIINTEQYGLAAARNMGIKAASGEYILFINPCDRISSITIDFLYKNAKKNNSDVVIFDFLWKNQDAPGYTLASIQAFKTYYKDSPFSIDKMGSLSYRLIPVSAWSKLYRTNLIKDKILFNEDISYQDIPFWAEVYANAQRVTYIPEAFYYWDRRNICPTVKEENADDVLIAYQRVEDILKKYGYFEKYKPSISILMIMDFLHKYNVLKPEEKESFFNSIKSLNKIIDYKLYESDDYTPIEKDCAKRFQLLNLVDFSTFQNSPFEVQYYD